MSVPTVALNEATPAGGDKIREGDDRIREYKTQNREILDIDHKYDSSGQDADMGKHNQVSLIEAADIGTGAEGLPILGAQTVDGKAELVFTDEDNNNIQITNAGALMAYPVGSIYMNAAVATNPNTLLGFGTWAAFGAGKVLIGLTAGDADFDTVEETGGAKTVDASHNHGGVTGTNTGSKYSGDSGTSSVTHSHTIASGGSATQSIVQPYIVVYMWKRTA